MAANDDEIGHPDMRGEQRHLRLGVRPHLVGKRVDPQEAVGLRERRDRAGALAGRICDQPSPLSTSDTITNSVRPGSDAIRTGILAVTLASERGGNPAMRRSTGTIMS